LSKRRRSFFCVAKTDAYGGEYICVPRSHWHAQSASSVITIQLRIRRHIPIVWRQRSTADSARLILFTKRLSNPFKSKGAAYV